VRALRDYESSYERFWQNFASRPPMSKATDGDLVITYGVAAAFSADEDGTVRLPFDLRTGRLVDDVCERWLAWDPVLSSQTERCAPRRSSLLVSSANQRSTRFGHDELVGVKCRTNLGCAASHSGSPVSCA
jgi:hypothetical protein